ncbi:MAG: dUTP diphosphatase [Candidatus Peribacteraceae bacterium]|nr:dUTP diphosphatase [Candidatus Peribacteraceae bacterium]
MGRIPNTSCDVCSSMFYKRPLALARDKTHCCSHACQNKLRKERMDGAGNHQFGLKGSLNESFKGDWRVSSYGYILVRALSHPLKMYDDYIFAHRLVYEEYLIENDSGSDLLITVDGRVCLTPDVVIHHIDENRVNNAISNLEAVKLGDHSYSHSLDNIIERNTDGTFRTVSKPKATKLIKRAHIEDAGHDIFSNEGVLIRARSSAIVHTGLKIVVPKDHAGLIWSRSGLSVKYGIEVGAGCIDEGYTGEVKIHLYNHSYADYNVTKGDRIAQVLFVPLNKSSVSLASDLTDTVRGEGGFGSTGTGELSD